MKPPTRTQRLILVAHASLSRSHLLSDKERAQHAERYAELKKRLEGTT